MKNYLRCMRVLLEWDLCGCVCKRMPGELRLTELPSGLQLLLDSFNAECRAKGLSESTVYSRNNRIKHFLIFLADGGGMDAGCITESSAHDYVLAKASLNPKSVKTILTAIRCFYRHLYLAGIVGRDLTATVPNPKSYYAPELPATWSAGDVDALLTSIDRGSPVGKRDYAMLLMVARLGLRASDIKSLRIEDLDWEARRISIAQHKTGVPLELPLLDDIGWAVIDYLRGGRPAGATCPELFVRHNAPFDAFGDTSNLTYILSGRAQAAGVKAGRDRKTLHSLRHALARRLLEQNVPIEDISRILGHVNKRTTSIYLRMDVGQLMGCPLDPEGVGA
jgi:site-specific recombinase XerD